MFCSWDSNSEYSLESLSRPTSEAAEAAAEAEVAADPALLPPPPPPPDEDRMTLGAMAEVI